MPLVAREADVKGAQRKAVAFSIRPLRWQQGDQRIPVRDGKSLPFELHREWSAPAGHYGERWYIIHPESREVLYESSLRETSIWGLQSLTRLTDLVREPIALEPGTYKIVFVLQGILGGEFEVQAVEIPAQEAA